MKFRVNYNQGQVSQRFHRINDAITHRNANGGSYIQRQEADTGEWFPCSDKGAFLDMTAKENADHPAK